MKFRFLLSFLLHLASSTRLFSPSFSFLLSLAPQFHPYFVVYSTSPLHRPRVHLHTCVPRLALRLGSSSLFHFLSLRRIPMSPSPIPRFAITPSSSLFPHAASADLFPDHVQRSAAGRRRCTSIERRAKRVGYRRPGEHCHAAACPSIRTLGHAYFRFLRRPYCYARPSLCFCVA
jgi:hypothetical protein